MLKLSVKRSGGVHVNDMRIRMLKISQRLKVSEINNLLKTVSKNALEIVKAFLLNKTYEKLGSTYQPLSESWLKRKVNRFKYHFYINTQSFLNGMYQKVTGGNLYIKPAEDMEERYSKLESMRPIIEDHKEYLANLIMKDIWDEFNKRI